MSGTPCARRCLELVLDLVTRTPLHVLAFKETTHSYQSDTATFPRSGVGFTYPQKMCAGALQGSLALIAT